MPKLLDTELEAANCSICGAVRPAVELKSEQGCGNCANLKMMAEQIKNQKKLEQEVKEHDAKLTETLEHLPKLDKICNLLYDNTYGTWWLGINLAFEKTDILQLMLLVDQAKVGLIHSYGDWKKREQEKKNKILVPGLIVNGVSSLVGKVSEIKDKAKKLMAIH